MGLDAPLPTHQRLITKMRKNEITQLSYVLARSGSLNSGSSVGKIDVIVVGVIDSPFLER